MIEAELEEIASQNADILSKEIKDLSDDEKALIVKHLTVYSLSDSFVELCKSVKTEFIPIIDQYEKKELEHSQLQRDFITMQFMEDVARMCDESEGGKVFKINLERNIKQFKKTINERIEPGYDAPQFTALDIAKHKKLLETSVAAWLSQTITAYEKPQPASEEQGAY